MKKIKLLALIPFFMLMLLQNLNASNVVRPSTTRPTTTPIAVGSMHPISIPNTTVIVVRHAEKDESWLGTDKECPLTESGKHRAETLKYMLENYEASAIFSTDTKRTKETVNDYAISKGLPITIYDDQKKLSDLIKTSFKAKSVLVVGHSDTVPEIIQFLGAKFPDPYVNGFDNFYVLTIRPDSSSSILRLKYAIND